jgi:hypothetical protein
LRLETGPDYRQRISLDVCGPMMAHIPPLVTGSLRMAIEGASVAHGRPPAWLQRTSDIRFVGYDHAGDDTLIALQLPVIGESAEELYRQRELWDTRPDPCDTAFEVFRRVVDEVTAENVESSCTIVNCSADFPEWGKYSGVRSRLSTWLRRRRQRARLH